MNPTLAGIALLGGAALAASSKRRRIQIIVGEIDEGRWMATVTGDGTEYLPESKRIVMAKSGHDGLKKMAAGWNRAGFLEGLDVPTRTPWLGSRFHARLRGRGQRRPRGQSRLGELGATCSKQYRVYDEKRSVAPWRGSYAEATKDAKAILKVIRESNPDSDAYFDDNFEILRRCQDSKGEYARRVAVCNLEERGSAQKLTPTCEKQKRGTRLKRNLAGWDSRAPMTKAARAKVAKKCGSRCFAGPNRSYPMCSKDSRVCGTDCMGARAAFSRARQHKKPKIALKAVKAGKKAGCSWVRGKAAQSVLKRG